MISQEQSKLGEVGDQVSSLKASAFFGGGGERESGGGKGEGAAVKWGRDLFFSP